MTGEMMLGPSQTMVETAANCPLGRLELTRFAWSEPIDQTLDEREEHIVDLCLSPRPRGARVNFRQVWDRNRYERIGKVMVVPGGFSAHARAGAGVQRSLVCRLSPTAISDWFDGEYDWTDGMLAAGLDVPRPEVLAGLGHIAAELARPGLASAMLLELLVAQLAIELARFYAEIPERAVGGLAPWRLRLIDERLAEGGAPPGLAELAQLVGLSVRQLTRGFRASRQTSIGSHIEQHRIDRAKKLLRSDLGLKEIAHRMGFASSSGFSYAFRNASGLSPREFRQRERANASTTLWA